MILQLTTTGVHETIDTTRSANVLKISQLEATVVSLIPNSQEVERTLHCSCIRTGTRLICTSCIESVLNEKTLMNIVLKTMASTTSMKTS